MPDHATLVALLERVRRRHAPEPRHAVFDARVRRRARRFTVRVATSELAAAAALERALRGQRGVTVSVVALPEPELARIGGAVVRVALAPLRREPSVRAEQVSQEVMGSVVEPLRRDRDWLLVRGADHYLGWLHAGAVHLEPGAAAVWDSAGADGALVLDGVVRDARGGPVARLPWGARVHAGADGRVTLADGRRGRLDDPRTVVRAEDLASRFPAEPDAVVATARTWIGVPYLWGGRTRWGADCSGFVQAVFALHGVALPRDSDLQAKAGREVKAGRALHGARPGDLIFFRAATSRRIAHVGISLGGTQLLHAAESNGEVAVDDLSAREGLGARLANRVTAVRRVLPI